MSPGKEGRKEVPVSSGLKQNRREERRRGGGREEGGGWWCVQRMLYASVSAVDGCCSVLARHGREGETKEKTQHK